MIDRIRHDIQQRLEQLLAEADKLRHALAALDPRERSAPKPKTTKSRSTAKRAAKTPDAHQAGPPPLTRTRTAGTANGASLVDADPAGRTKTKVLAALSSDQSVDGWRGREGDRARTRDSEHNSVKALEDRRGRQGRPWLPPPQHRQRNPKRFRTGGCPGDRRRVDILTASPTLLKGPPRPVLRLTLATATAISSEQLPRPAALGRQAKDAQTSISDGAAHRWQHAEDPVCAAESERPRSRSLLPSETALGRAIAKATERSSEPGAARPSTALVSFLATSAVRWPDNPCTTNGATRYGPPRLAA